MQSSFNGPIDGLYQVLWELNFEHHIGRKILNHLLQAENTSGEGLFYSISVYISEKE